MYRFFIVFLLISAFFISCSKDDKGQPTPDPIPDVINGVITEIDLTPVDITTPGTGRFFISANNTRYQVEFSAVALAASNATLTFDTDTILTDQSREYANLGIDVISYNPVKENQIIMSFNDGRRVTGVFDFNTSFGGVFGETLISQWRDPSDPSKPNQKAKDDIINLVRRYGDKDGPGPEIAPQFLFATVSRV
ncbi:MAG TPA: hypothetical protein VFD56_12880 [Chitinophagaceae bacterium]|nr:hypothetical protein [Chitinophagaceae bacterium]